MEYNKAIQLLNSFTPQGASPRLSIRIATWNNQLGFGYYQMEDDENANLTTILKPFSDDNFHLSKIPLSEMAIEEITRGNHKRILQTDSITNLEITKEFGENASSMILYSILSGDNMIIIHPEHEKRVEFLKGILKFIPTKVFQYNRITTGCAELDGNENIIGVEELPLKYRSHKKLYMPLDTIFIDIEQQEIMGEGLKNNQLTQQIVGVSTKNEKKANKLLKSYFEDISKDNFSSHEKYGLNTRTLTEKIRTKMGLETASNDDWFTAF